MKVTIPCSCPNDDHPFKYAEDAKGKPTDEVIGGGDTVVLRAVLDFHRATTITKAVQFIDSDDDRVRSAEVLATLSEFYVLMGVEAWSIRDEDRKPLPVTQAAIRANILDRPEAAAVVVDAADGLYAKAILLPLLARASNSSQPSPTPKPTSAKLPGEQPKRPRPSKRSSISTIPTAATETTSASLDGVSSSSQSSESAA